MSGITYIVGEVAEQTTQVIRIFVTDRTGALVPSMAYDSITVTLREEQTGEIINNRNGQNALNANGFTLPEDGVIEWKLSTDDTAIVGPTRVGQAERHKLTMTLVWDNGDETTQIEVVTLVYNLRSVPQETE